jgi:hypothetical protein
VNFTDSPNDDTLAGQVEKQNARLQALIEGVDQLVATSRALLARLQRITRQSRPGSTGGISPLCDLCDDGTNDLRYQWLTCSERQCLYLHAVPLFDGPATSLLCKGAGRLGSAKLPDVGPAQAEKRVALVIGNSAYLHTRVLLNPGTTRRLLPSCRERAASRMSR